GRRRRRGRRHRGRRERRAGARDGPQRAEPGGQVGVVRDQPRSEAARAGAAGPGGRLSAPGRGYGGDRAAAGRRPPRRGDPDGGPRRHLGTRRGRRGRMSLTESHEHLTRDGRERKGFFTDTSICIGCKACEVACKEWNHIPTDSDWELRDSSYDNTGELGADTWRHVAFIEQGSEQIE